MSKMVLATLLAALAVPAMADSFLCGNDTDLPNARWYVQVSHTREAGEGRKPGFFLLHNAKADGSIVRTDDRRRIRMGGKDAKGTTYTVKLNKTEKKALRALADGRVNVSGAERVTLWVDAEPNEDLVDGKENRAASISVTDAEEEEVYSTALRCSYDDVSDDKKKN